MSSRSAKSSERYVTRRVMDEDGNIVAKRYKKSSSAIQIPWNRSPSFLLGTVFALYAYVVNLYRKGELADSALPSDLTESLTTSFESIDPIASLLLTTVVTVGLGSFLGFALITKGFKVKKWFAAGRQLLAIFFMATLLTGVFSAFINEAGVIRHQENQVDATDDYDISDLAAPFYSELLNGLLDLIGNIPNPQELVATITPANDSFTLDSDLDNYLWRWLVAETYGDDFDYDKGYTEYQSTLDNADPGLFTTVNPEAESKKFRIEQQYLTLGTSFSGETVNPWHSLYDGQVDISNPSLELLGTEGDFAGSDPVSVVNNINNQPVLSASFTQSRTAGYLGYDAYWVEEDKQAIAENSISYPNFTESVKAGISSDRFPTLSQAGSLSSIWGSDSLPANYLTAPATADIDPAAFYAKYDQYIDQAVSGASVYSLALQASNEIQAALLDMFSDPNAASSLNPSSGAATANEAIGIDRAYYFWDQVDRQELFGIKDAIAGFVNLLRALDIPARPILGFSVGDVQSDKIELRLEHISVWIEALIPWNDNGTTRYSWGMFNPIPNYGKLLQGEFVYGRNSLGGSPDVEIEASNGEDTDIPDQDIGDTSSFVLAQLNEPLNMGSRVLYEGEPTVGQNIDIKLLTEQEIIDLADGNVDPTAGLTLGVDLATVKTTNTDDAWANFSILVNTDQSASFEYDGDITPMDPIPTINIAGTEGNRNIYAIVALQGLSFNFILVGWIFEGDIVFDATDPIDGGHESVKVTDPGLLNGDEVVSAFALLDEPLLYEAVLTDPDDNVLAGETVNLVVLTPDDLDAEPDALLTLLTNKAEDPQITDANGYVQFNYTFSSISTDPVFVVGEYYVLGAWHSFDIFDYIVVHITEDVSFNYTITNQIVLEDRLIDLGEETQYDLAFDSLVTDVTIDAIAILGGGIDGRPLIDSYTLEYHIMTKAAYDANIGTPATFVIVLATCETDLSINNPDCYQLTTAGFASDVFGIAQTNRTLGVQIIMTGGVVSLNSYYLVIYDPITDVFYANPDQRFLFTSDPVMPLAIQPIHFNVNLQNDPVIEETTSNTSTISPSWGLLVILSGVMTNIMTRMKEVKQ